jgi:hypothetical protein
MKKSKRYLLGTLIFILSSIVLYVAANRLLEMRAPAFELQRTPAAVLAQFNGFTRIVVHGDFGLTLHSTPDYSISYFPLSADRGTFTATQEGEVLTLRGFGNRSNESAASVVIGMPHLTRVQANALYQLQLSGFETEALSMDLTDMRSATLENNRLGNLDLSGSHLRQLYLRNNIIGTRDFRMIGTMNIEETAAAVIPSP